MRHVLQLLRRISNEEDRARTRNLELPDAGHGYDAFGAHREWIAAGLRITAPLHDHYFRVSATGVGHIPGHGPAIIVANHSGTLPFDAMMLWANILRVTAPPRIARALADFFVPQLPFASTVFARMGVVAGSRDNARVILESGELMMVFPEGVRGIGKPFAERYRLQRWHHGHVELSVRHRVPIIPVAIIGAEEQMPQIARIEGIRLFGAPYLPIPATPLPLPVHYHIEYGPPIRIFDDDAHRDADDPHTLEWGAQKVKAKVQALINHGLAKREGVFR